MDEEDDRYRSSEDEDFVAGSSGDDADESKAPPAAKPGKRRRSARGGGDALEAVDASEAADLAAAAREAYGADFLAPQAGVQGGSVLGAAALDALLREMNEEQPRPRLVLTGSTPLRTPPSTLARSDSSVVVAIETLISSGLESTAGAHRPLPKPVLSTAQAALATTAIIRGGGLPLPRGAAASGGGGEAVSDDCTAGGGSGSLGQEPLKRIQLPTLVPQAVMLQGGGGAARRRSRGGASNHPAPWLEAPELASLRAALQQRPPPRDAPQSGGDGGSSNSGSATGQHNGASSASNGPSSSNDPPSNNGGRISGAACFSLDPRLVEAMAAARAAAASKKVAIVQTVKFAGQTMQVTKLVTPGTLAAQKAQEQAAGLAARAVLAAAATATVPGAAAGAPLVARSLAASATASGAAAAPAPATMPAPSDAATAAGAAGGAVGLSAIVANLDKPEALSTMAKSSLDWDSFKHGEGIGDELERAAAGGFVEKQAFLARVDGRTFEAEREQRARDRARADTGARR